MHAEVSYPLPGTNLDLFLYEPGSYDDSSNHSIRNTGLETIDAPNAPAGVYYLVIDSESAPGTYQLRVSAVPEPALLSACFFMSEELYC